MFPMHSLKESPSLLEISSFKMFFHDLNLAKVLSASEPQLGFIFLDSCTYSIASKVIIPNTQFPQNNANIYSDLRLEHSLDFQHPQLHLKKMINFDIIGKYPK